MTLLGHETVFAITACKGQGLEFDELMVILPDRPSPVLTPPTHVHGDYGGSEKK